MSLTKLCLFPIIFLLAQQINSQFCKDPQKGIFMSYQTMSKMETLSDLFRLINTKLPKFNEAIVKDTNTYQIINLSPQLYYNQHYQFQGYVDRQTISVSLGKITLGYVFSYRSTIDGTKNAGIAMGNVEADGKNFIKKLIVKNGVIQWDPSQILDIKVFNNLTIQVSTPKMTFSQKTIFQQMLNQEQAGHNLRTDILTNVNQYYKSLLKEHLNNQTVANSEKIIYKYKNYTFNFVNQVKNYSLYNTNKTKGLEVFFLFELEGKTKNCTADNIYLGDETLGGLQQVYSVSSFRQALKDAASSGFFDVTLDKTWEVPVFQFYMGDLSGSIAQANRYPAAQPFTVDCKWNRDSSFKLSGFSNSQLYAQFSLNCVIIYNNRQLVQLQLLPNFVIKIIAEDETLNFRISKTDLYTFNVKSIDPKFIVTNKELMKFQVQQIINGLNKQLVVGTGWKTLKRKFPSAYITSSQQYITVFDPSQL